MDFNENLEKTRNNAMTSNSRCDCCGFSTQSQTRNDCPRCGYPIDPAKEEQFLAAASMPILPLQPTSERVFSLRIIFNRPNN